MSISNHNSAIQKTKTWLLQDRHRQRARKLRSDVEKAFTEHPESSGETYLEHLWFTIRMSGRFAFVSSAIIIHGIFPFLCTRTASHQIENVYRIMKTRIPKKRRDEIDQEFLPPIRIASPSGVARIAIIGGGFSGSLVLAQLVRASEGNLIIDMFEPRVLGEGVAYSTQDPGHLLNVKADNMSAFADHPSHFVDWLSSDAGKTTLAHVFPGAEVSGKSFVPRAVYAGYIKHILNEALSEAQKRHIVVNIHATSVLDANLQRQDTQQLSLLFNEEGKAHELVVDAAILATGNPPPRAHGFRSGFVAGSEHYIEDVWNWQNHPIFTVHLHERSANDEIVIIGTGLTMVDSVLSLRHKGFKGRIIAISRSGLMPSVHSHSEPYPMWEWVHSPHYAPRTALGMLMRLREEVRKAKVEGYGWQSVMDSLRSITPMLWQQLELNEKRKFLARLSTIWNIHRHRMAPEIYQEIRSLQQSGTLNIIAGKIYYLGSDKDGMTVAYRRRGTNRMETMRASLVLNCSGPEYDIATCHHPLLKRLRDRGLITIGPLRAGIELTKQGTAKGKAEKSLFPIGSLLIGELLECTAVPELRQQAMEVAQRALQRVKQLHSF